MTRGIDGGAAILWGVSFMLVSLVGCKDTVDPQTDAAGVPDDSSIGASTGSPADSAARDADAVPAPDAEQAALDASAEPMDGGTADEDADDDAGESALDAAPFEAGAPPGCRPASQDGCDAGEKCDISGAQIACVPAGSLAEFRRCEPGSEELACGAGYTCLDTVFGDHRCAKYCDPNAGASCAGQGQTCSSMRTTAAGERYFTCTLQHGCSPIHQDCLDTARSCVWTLSGAFCVAQSGRAADGEACSTGQDCAPGSTCFGENLEQRCFKMCAVGASDGTCGQEQTCEALGEVWPDEIGICVGG